MKPTALRQSKIDKDIQKTLKMAFWDRTIPHSEWRKAISQGDPKTHCNVIVSSFKYLPMRWLVDHIGEEKFVKRWPLLRGSLEDSRDPLSMQRLEAWDAIWGILSVGDSQYPIRKEIVSLGRKKLDLLKTIVTHGVCSTYDLSKISGRNYSRVYKDVRYLVEGKLVSLTQEKTAENRTVNILRSTLSVNSDLVESSRGALKVSRSRKKIPNSHDL